MLLIQYFIPLLTIGVGCVLVAGTCNKLQTETRVDRKDLEKTNSVTNIYNETGTQIKWFLGRNCAKKR